MRIVELSSESRDRLLEDLLKRSPNSYGEFEGRVAAILADVKERRDAALFEYTKKFDGADISADNLVVTEEEIREAYETVDPSLVEIIRKALVNIRAYHEKQRRYSWFDSKPNGSMLGQKITPLRRVGVYVPGRQGRLSVFRAHEHCSGQGGRGGGDRYDHTAGKRR